MTHDMEKILPGYNNMSPVEKAIVPMWMMLHHTDPTLTPLEVAIIQATKPEAIRHGGGNDPSGWIKRAKEELIGLCQ